MALIGLDYNAVLAVANIYKIEITAELFEKIQALEFDTLSEHREKNKQSKK